MRTESFSLEINSSINPYKKSIAVDSDKSLSIRSFLIGSISQGVSKVSNVLESHDVFSAISSLKKLGVKIYKNKKNCKIHGVGINGYNYNKKIILNAGNSGTLGRLILGLLILSVACKEFLTKLVITLIKFVRSIFTFSKSILDSNEIFFSLKISNANLVVEIISIFSFFWAGSSAKCEKAVDIELSTSIC